MIKIDERLLNILADHPAGMNSHEIVEFLRNNGEDITATGNITKQLSNLHHERKVFSLTGPQRRRSTVYFHTKFLSTYKPSDVVFKTKKVDEKQRCLDLYHTYVTTGDKHSLELAERLYKELV